MGINREVILSADLIKIKTASRALVRTYGGQLAAAKRLNISQQRVSDCCCRNKDAFFRLDQIVTLEAESGGAGHPHVTEVMAQLHDMKLVKLNSCVATGRDLLQLYATQSQSIAALAQQILEAQVSEVVTPHDAKQIEQAADAVISVALHIRAEAQLIQKQY